MLFSKVSSDVILRFIVVNKNSKNNNCFVLVTESSLGISNQYMLLFGSFNQ